MWTLVQKRKVLRGKDIGSTPILEKSKRSGETLERTTSPFLPWDKMKKKRSVRNHLQKTPREKRKRRLLEDVHTIEWR